MDAVDMALITLIGNINDRLICSWRATNGYSILVLPGDPEPQDGRLSLFYNSASVSAGNSKFEAAQY